LIKLAWVRLTFDSQTVSEVEEIGGWPPVYFFGFFVAVFVLVVFIAVFLFFITLFVLIFLLFIID